MKCRAEEIVTRQESGPFTFHRQVSTKFATI